MDRASLADMAQSPDTAPAQALGVFSSLELRHLVALDAVATEGTFGRAAERLGYTQSAVSQQIAALERTLGGAVFDRPGGPRPVRLTPLGKLVLGHARDILARAQATADAVERFKAGEGGRIDIGTFQSVSNVLLPAVRHAAARRAPRRRHPPVRGRGVGGGQACSPASSTCASASGRAATTSRASTSSTTPTCSSPAAASSPTARSMSRCSTGCRWWRSRCRAT